MSACCAMPCSHGSYVDHCKSHCVCIVLLCSLDCAASGVCVCVCVCVSDDELKKLLLQRLSLIENNLDLHDGRHVINEVSHHVSFHATHHFNPKPNPNPDLHDGRHVIKEVAHHVSFHATQLLSTS